MRSVLSTQRLPTGLNRLRLGLVLFLADTWLGTGVLAHAQLPADVEQAAVGQIEQLGGYVYRTADNQVDIVSMSGPNFTDAHLELLFALPTVRMLNLNGSRVTDNGLEQLMKLPKLEEVSLRRTQVTRAAALAFKDRHPGVYSVDAPPGPQPDRLVFAGFLIIPLLFGVWLVRLTIRKGPVLSRKLYGRGIVCGLLVSGVSAIMIIVAIIQALGYEFSLADVFG